MTDAEWYYAEEGEQQGPVSLAEMRRLVAAKRIQPDDLVWCEGMDDWLPAGDIASLNAAKQKPKPVRKAEPAEAKTDGSKPLTESAGQAAERSKSKPAKSNMETAPAATSLPVVAPPVVVQDDDPFPSLGIKSTEDDDDSEADELDEEAEALFARPKFPAKRPRGFERQPRREPEIVREVTREVVVASNGDARLSTAALVVQLICWVLGGLTIVGLTGTMFAVGLENLSAANLLLPVSVGTLVVCHSIQRSLEIISAIRNK